MDSRTVQYYASQAAAVAGQYAATYSTAVTYFAQAFTPGNWIADATILGWAELTAEISEGALKPSQVVDHLLAVPIPEREVSAARAVYAALPAKVCVWTARSLGDAFDVDHAIPFALWGNNDLWNLLPALPAVNNQKRDRLPSRGRFQQRKECIMGCWSRLREARPDRFRFEVGNAETGLRAGVALGRAMVELLDRGQTPVRSETAKPTRHVARTVEGWTVRVDDRLLAPPHEETGRRALRFLEARLFDIRAVVPAGPLERLQRVVLVLDLSHGELTAMQYGLTDPKEFFGPPNIPSIVQAALYDVGGGGVASLLASGRVSG